jgi:hypothetical protein
MSARSCSINQEDDVTTTQVSQSTLISALLGDNPAALTEDVSLATPLTLARITGRDAVVAALGADADVIGATDADLRVEGDRLEGVVFATTVDGHSAQAKDSLGPEYWQGPDPEGPLPIR